MAKAYRCADCKIVRSTKWTNRCPGCFGFFNIQIVSGEGPAEYSSPDAENAVESLSEVAHANIERFPSDIVGFDLVLGYDKVTSQHGIAQKSGHTVQIFGSPGAGKSTLLLQVANGFARRRMKVLYVAGEESKAQIRSRADRIGIKIHAKLLVTRETDLDAIIDAIESEEPDIVVIDSINKIQVDDYELGSLLGIKLAGNELHKLAERRGFGLIFVVQVNKGGDFSGPRALEHEVDTAMHLTVAHGKVRHLHVEAKNRHGDVPAHAYFLMTDHGLVEWAPAISDADSDADAEDGVESENGSVSAVQKVKKSRKKKLALGPIPPDQKTAQPEPVLKSIPSDGIHTPSTELVVPEDAKNVLTVSCDTCEAKVDRACTSDSGVRESGFHQSRVTKSKLRLVGAEVAAPLPEPVLPELPEPPTIEEIASRLTAKPRLKPKAKSKSKKKSPPEPTP